MIYSRVSKIKGLKTKIIKNHMKVFIYQIFQIHKCQNTFLMSKTGKTMKKKTLTIVIISLAKTI